MTAGADGTTIDGMSDERIQRIIESMRDKSYLPKPARREYIAKKTAIKSARWESSQAMTNWCRK